MCLSDRHNLGSTWDELTCTRTKAWPLLLSPVSQPIKPPGTGKVPFFREKKHMLKPLTMDLLWILSSRGLPVPCPVSHYDSSTARENGGLVARDLVTQKRERCHSPSPWFHLNSTSDRWLSPQDLAVHWENRWRKIGWGWRENMGRSKPNPSWHILLVNKTLATTFHQEANG